nr:hypothetical protein BaRGS_034767 [Batillaria attramentaria]
MNACRKKPAAPLHPIPVPKKKWSLVGMDIIGPLQVTDRGNQYIVALTDHFTKFPVAKAIPCKSSEEVARFMYETICIFGAFDSLITDQGREFINFALDILTDRFNINHRISSAYHPETNGQRERDNRTLKDTLVKITDNDDWDELLPAALFAYRTSVHKSTQFSPFLALYGEQAKLPFDVTGDANEQDLNEEIMDTMKGIHEEVKNKIGENISRAQKKQKEYYDSRRAYDHGFRIGDKVLIINAARVHRMGGKMAPRFVGPYENVEMLIIGRATLGIGIVSGQFAGGGFSYLEKDGWRCSSLIQLIGFIFLPESPRWAMKKGDEARAREILQALRGTKDVEQELQEIRVNCEEDEKTAGPGNGPTILLMLKSPNMRRALVVGCGLQLFQQISGINTVILTVPYFLGEAVPEDRAWKEKRRWPKDFVIVLTVGVVRIYSANLTGASMTWAYDYCPTSYSWIAVFGLALYLMFFAPGMGPMPWTINAEIYPLWARSTGNSMSAATNWIANLVVSMTFLTLTETITKYALT